MAEMHSEQKGKINQANFLFSKSPQNTRYWQHTEFGKLTAQPQQGWADPSNVESSESHYDAAMLFLRTDSSQNTPDAGSYLELGFRSMCLIQHLLTA